MVQLGAPVPYVFFRVNNKAGRARGLGSYAKRWTTACRKSGVEGKRVHELRQGAIRSFERAGTSRSVAMSLSDHKAMSVYSRYAICDLNSQREGITKLAALVPHRLPL